MDKDSTKAREQFEAAVEGGHMSALCCLDILYKNRAGVAGDSIKARELSLRCAIVNDLCGFAMDEGLLEAGPMICDSTILEQATACGSEGMFCGLRALCRGGIWQLRFESMSSSHVDRELGAIFC